MKRVTIVNLAGRAYHVEDDAVAVIEAWLEAARTRLTTDPDREELLADFERAIADRCDARVSGERDVVTVAHAREIVDALGNVEPADADPSEATTTTPSQTSGTPPRADTPWRERRLYRLTGDGDAQIAGVCAGIAAYLNMDVTVVRVLTVILAVVTSGAAAIVYIAMALLVPEASSPEQRAAVRGYGETAQEMMSRARDGAGPALASLGSLITRAWRVAVAVLHAVMITATWLLLAAWAAGTAWLVADGDGLVSAFDDGTSRWLVALWVTCIAWIAISIVLRIAVATGTPRERSAGRPSRAFTMARDTAWAISVVVSILGVFAIPASSSSQLAGLTDGQGRVELAGRTYCVEESGREASTSERCRPGDEILDD